MNKDGFFAALFNGAAMQEGENLAGMNNIFAHMYAGTGRDPYDAFEEGRKNYRKQLRDFRYQSPYMAFAAETAGGLLTGAAAGRGLKNSAKWAQELVEAINRPDWKAIYKVRREREAQKEQENLLWHLNNWRIQRRGERQLREALQNQRFDRNIMTGRFTRWQMDEINAIRRAQGYEELTDNNLVWMPPAQRHVWKERILGNSVNPAKIAQWQRNAFFSKNSKAFSTKDYPNITEVRSPSGRKWFRGFITRDPYTGNTKATSIYRSRIKKGT